MFKVYLILILSIKSVLALGQHTYLIGSFQLNSLIDENTLLSDYEFQLNSKASANIYTPLYFDSLKSREWIGLEVGLGSLVNSYYYTNSNNQFEKKSTDFNGIAGLFLNIEPYYNFAQVDKYNIKFHVSVNFMTYFFNRNEKVKQLTTQDSIVFKQKTFRPKNQVHFGMEPSVGVTYVLPLQNGGVLFRLKGGPIIHNKKVASLTAENTPEIAEPTLNDYQLSFSVGYQIK